MSRKLPQSPVAKTEEEKYFTWAWHLKALAIIYGLLAVGYVLLRILI